MTIYLVGLLALIAAFGLCAWLVNRKRKGTVNMANTTTTYAVGSEFGAQVHTDGLVSRYSSAAITTRHLLYKDGADDLHVAVLTGASDLAIGTVIDEATAAEETVTVKLLGKGATTRMVSNGTVTAQQLVYQTAAGKVASSGTIIVGIALTAGATDGDIVEVADMSVSANAATPGIPASTGTAADQALVATGASTIEPVQATAGTFLGKLTAGLLKFCSITEVLTELGGNSAPTGTGKVVRQTTPTLVTPVLGAATGTSLAVSGAITSSGGGVGYATGAGDTVTQITTRATGVTIDKLCGNIITDTTSLAVAGIAKFTVTNNKVAAGDVVVVCLKTDSATALSTPHVTDVAAGSFEITLINQHASTADTSASTINFAVIKAVAA